MILNAISSITPVRFSGRQAEPLFEGFFDWLDVLARGGSTAGNNTAEFMFRSKDGVVAFSLIPAAKAYCAELTAAGKRLNSMLNDLRLVNDPDERHLRMSRFVRQRLSKQYSTNPPFKSVTPQEVRAGAHFRNSVSASQARNAKGKDFNLRNLTPDAQEKQRKNSAAASLSAARDLTHAQYADPALTALIEKLLPLHLTTLKSNHPSGALPKFSPLAWLRTLQLTPALAKQHSEIQGLAASIKQRKSPQLNNTELMRLRRHCVTISNDPGFKGCQFTSVFSSTGPGQNKRRSLLSRLGW